MTIEEARELVADALPLFSPMIFKLKIVEDKEETETAATDGQNLFYNPEFTDKLTDDELCAVVLHEILHCTFSHLWRRKKRDPERWNFACDYAINITVSESFKLPEGCLFDMKYYGMSSEEIYDSFPEPKKKKGKMVLLDGDGKPMKKPTWGDHSKWPGTKPKKKKAKGIVGKVKDALSPKKKASKTKSDSQLEEEWNEIFEECVLKNYGKLPGSIKRLIEKTYYIPVIDWTTLLSQLLSADVNDYAFHVPDRRFLGGNFVMPGLYSVDNLKDVVFAYDTSGSITPEDLHAYYMESINLFSNFYNLDGWVAICDADLHAFKEIGHNASFEEFDFYGGGGTDFRPVFDEIAKRELKPKALFYFTDTEGSFPREEPPYPVFWLVRSSVGENHELQVPFGQVIRFLDTK